MLFVRVMPSSVSPARPARRRVQLGVRVALLAFLAASLAMAGHWLTERPYAPKALDDEATAIPQFAALPAAEPHVSMPDAGGSATANAAPAPPPSVDEPAAVPVGKARNLGLDTDNYLLIGIDRYKGLKRGGSTDTLLVAAFDRKSDHVGLVSVPRDLYVEVEGHGQTRINAVYGLARMDKADPLRALQRVVEDTLGLPIAHTIVIDMQLFESAIDAVDGIDVEVECALLDNFIDARTESGRRSLDVEAGVQHMDGVTASMFVRSRHGSSDFGRARRQQAVLLALRRKLSSLEGVTELPELFEQVEGSLETHMSRLQLLALARRALRVMPGHLHGVVLGHKETVPFRTEQNWSVLLPDGVAIEAKLGALFSAPKPGAPLAAASCPKKDAALQPRGAQRKQK